MKQAVGETSTMVEIEDTQVEVGISTEAMSDDDFFANLGLKIDNPDVIADVLQHKAEQETRAEVIDRLEAHFGSRVFTYKSYQGTIADVISRCPAVEHQLKGGFDSFVEWIEANETKLEEEHTPTEDDEVHEAEDGLLSTQPGGDVKESAKPVAVENDTKKVETKPLEKADPKPISKPAEVVTKAAPEAASVVPIFSEVLKSVEKQVKPEKTSQEADKKRLLRHLKLAGNCAQRISLQRK